MKTIISILCLLLFCSPASAETRVYFLMGQSNAEAFAIPAETLDQSLLQFPANVVMYHRVYGPVTDLSPLPRYGVEAIMARTLGEAYPYDQIVIIKWAIGGTSMMAWKPDWNFEDAELTENGIRGPLYKRATTFAKGTIGDADVRYCGLVFIQGERDGQSEWDIRVVKEYYDNMVNMIYRMRQDFGTDFPVFIPLVSNKGELMIDIRRDQLRLSVDMNGVYAIDTLHLTKMIIGKAMLESAHYDTAGILELGKRISDEILRVGD